VERAWGNLLVTILLLAGLGLGGCFFLALCGVTGARWHRPLIPLARAVTATLPLTGLVAGTVVLGGLFCYPWTDGFGEHTASYWFKTAWLSQHFFVVRSIAYVVVWAAAARWMTAGSPGAGRSALVLVLLAVSVILASFDWVMSLEPLWFSTMFGVHQFAGVFLSGLAGLVVLAAWCKRCHTHLEEIHEQHLHDLGKLLFGFSCFWMYIWFSQYMLIWYVNIPEESVYYIRRTEGLWWPLMLLNLALNWGIPFFTLLPRPAKRSWTTMVRVSTLILLGRWLDLHLMIVPPQAGEGTWSGAAELGGLLVCLGVVLLFLSRRGPAAAAAPVTVQDIQW
jgi:hypothetical protein